MTFTVIPNPTGTQFQQDGADFLSTDASGNVSARVNGTMQSLLSIASLGVGQTWQDVTGSRVLGTTYTNTTGRPIFVSVRLAHTNAITTVTVSGVVVSQNSGDAVGEVLNVMAVVPNGATYTVTGNSLTSWSELR